MLRRIAINPHFFVCGDILGWWCEDSGRNNVYLLDDVTRGYGDFHKVAGDCVLFIGWCAERGGKLYGTLDLGSA